MKTDKKLENYFNTVNKQTPNHMLNFIRTKEEMKKYKYVMALSSNNSEDYFGLYGYNSWRDLNEDIKVVQSVYKVKIYEKDGKQYGSK